MLPAFFALVSPDSSMQKPACIKNTSAAPTSTHTVLTAEKSITISSLNSIFFVMSSGQVDPSLSGLLKLQSFFRTENFCFLKFYPYTKKRRVTDYS